MNIFNLTNLRSLKLKLPKIDEILFSNLTNLTKLFFNATLNLRPSHITHLTNLQWLAINNKSNPMFRGSICNHFPNVKKLKVTRDIYY